MKSPDVRDWQADVDPKNDNDDDQQQQQQQQQQVTTTTEQQDNNNSSPTSDVQPRKETPLPMKRQQQQDSSSSRKKTPSPNKRRQQHQNVNDHSNGDDIPSASYFLLGSPPAVSIVAMKSKQQHHQTNNFTGSENFFKQHISFVDDQPSDPDFVPSPSWFQQHSHEEYVHLVSTPGSTKIDQNHQRLLMKEKQSMTMKSSSRNTTSSPARPSYYNSSSPSSPGGGRRASRPLHEFNDYSSSDQNTLRRNFHHEHGNVVGNSSSSAPEGAKGRRANKSSESLQHSLNELRRKQIIRTALEDGRVLTSSSGANGNSIDDDEDEMANADYWLSPSQQEQSERRIRSSSVLRNNSSEGSPNNNNNASRSNTASNNNNNNSRRSPRAPPSVVQRLKAFASAEEFGEELIVALLRDLFHSFVIGSWILLQRFGNWLYRLGYFMVTGVALTPGAGGGATNEIQNNTTTKDDQETNERKTSSTNDTGRGFPSPFPQFYRDAFFSTWSPHEILEPVDLPMTNAFMPSPLPKGANSTQQAVEMLRPTPAPAFWWIGMMEISGRHFIESQWAQSLQESVVAPAMREAREMWMIHEDEVMRGSDLVSRVVRRGCLSSSSVDDGEEDYADETDDAYRFRVNQGPFREL